MMMGMIMAAALVLVKGSGSQPPWKRSEFAQPPCNIRTQTPEQYCEAYCTDQCSFYNTSLGDTGKPTNMTIYRLTPRHVRGVEDHNTGDVPGDVGFVLANRRHILECLRKEISDGCFLDNTTDNIYGAFDIEFDGRIGPYYQCNPEYQNASNPFQCWQKCGTPPDCHNASGYDSWVNGSDNWAGAQCFCQHCPRCNKSVGRAPNPYSWHGHVPHGWPRQCYSFDEVPDGLCLTGHVWKTVTGPNLAATLESVCNLCEPTGYHHHSPCAAFTVTNNTTANVYSHVEGKHTPAFGSECVSGDFTQKWGGSVGVAIGGYWFSTPADGKCASGTTLGHDGCTWRYRTPARYYDSKCVDSRVDRAVETHGKACFDDCPQPKNQTSLCYSECYAATLEGDPIHNITTMRPDQVTRPWESAFLPQNFGGCPQIQL